jgi:hypothetical protein
MTRRDTLLIAGEKRIAGLDAVIINRGVFREDTADTVHMFGGG